MEIRVKVVFFFAGVVIVSCEAMLSCCYASRSADVGRNTDVNCAFVLDLALSLH